MATPGTFISGVGHVGLMAWLILGWGFSAEPLQIETMDVSVISGEEFEQMRARTTPDPGDADPLAPVPPEVTAPPVAPAAEDPPAPAPPPDTLTPPASETPPPDQPAPPVEAEVAEVQPPAPVVPDAPPPQPDLEVSEQPSPPQAPTVASELTQPQPPDAVTDDIVRDEVVARDDATPDIVQEEQEATAPEETTTAIVIEDLAPTTSVRPTTRPSRPTPTAVPTETATTEPETPTQEPAEPSDDVAAALADVLAGADAPAVAAGPPMSGAERDSFRVSVNRCWNVDPGSVAARVTVEVGFRLDRDGTVTGNEVRLISSDGDQSATDTAFAAARRAILRCQSGGYDLPADKYDQWQDVVITFDPSGMRLR